MLKAVTELLQSCAGYVYRAISNAITSVTGFIFGSDAYSTDSDSDSDSDYDPIFANNDRAELFPTESTRLINSAKKYAPYRTLEEDRKGKNKTAAIHHSYSQKTGAIKLWVSKEKLETRLCRYGIDAITTEIFVAWLNVYTFGKANTPKAKFNPASQGILSRIVGDNDTTTKDLYDTFLINTPYQPIPEEARDSFLKQFIFAIIVGNRDIAFENFIFKTDAHGQPIIYLIDNEFALAPPLIKPTSPLLAMTSTIRSQHMSLRDLLHALDADQNNFARIILDENFDWNNIRNRNFYINTPPEIIAESFRQINSGFFASFTQIAFRATLQELVRSIEANDFAICEWAKAKMLQQLASAPDTYPPEVVSETIIPRIAAATAALKQNVACINEFLAEKGLQATGVPSQDRPAYRS